MNWKCKIGFHIWKYLTPSHRVCKRCKYKEIFSCGEWFEADNNKDFFEDVLENINERNKIKKETKAHKEILKKEHPKLYKYW